MARAARNYWATWINLAIKTPLKDRYRVVKLDLIRKNMRLQLIPEIFSVYT